MMVYAQEEQKKDAEKKAKSIKEYMADLTSDKEEGVILEAVHFVGKEKEKDAVPNLISLLSDKRAMVRMVSASSLGLIADESSVDALNKTLLGDESPEVRYAAVLATFRIGSKKSLDTWKQALASDSDPFIKDFLTKMEAKMKGK